MMVQGAVCYKRGERLKKKRVYGKLISSLADPQVDSLKRKSTGYHAFTKLMKSNGWKPEAKPWGRKGSKVDFYKERSRQIVQVEASHSVWIGRKLRETARRIMHRKIKGAYLIVSLNEKRTRIYRESVLQEVRKTKKALGKRMCPLVVLCCERPVRVSRIGRTTSRRR
jgi:hypothetical protein